ncbi:MAG: ferredoxin--NADP reductase [Sulfitobacter sp.]|jgi:ferredoxin/flavodoxin---NADP+ reductase|uniref:ferredoxin--NADP reductase n=1 Tax=Sulfitobacter sp. TaxID=1903071 RepID=UPI000C0CE02C|nr:ferredoxin--NADP(+) reductase [Roseobacter sp.]MBV47235.1 ferredoxin--NADP(+) reductase [Roseobacter sp.]PHR04603.1 MAG: ferredoxin--NADP(+) reductase [Sulfitobacter sp.]|tara:strand:+ start:2660 stop:3496 length:837 start_codon:yes stop_codon:yes gene_type:complete
MTEQKPVTQTNAKPVPTLPDAQTVTSVKHWTDSLFSFRVSRPASLRFRSGEFVMIGLLGDPDPKSGKQKPLLRAYSIASPSWDEELEFYSIKVQDGPLTSKLQHIQPGDQLILRPKPVGTLVHDALLPGKRLWLFATGTGFAPFASLLREPETYEKFDQVIVTHTTRDVADLEYSQTLINSLDDDPLIGDLVEGKVVYYPTTTREHSSKMGRITTLLENGTVFEDLGIDGINAETDRGMVCGSLGFNKDIKDILEGFGLEEGANSDPQHYVVEKAFVG